MNESYSIIQSLLRTEKGAVLSSVNKYLFSVRKDANKIQIKRAVEDLYKVKVKDVNTILVPGKPRRVRYRLGLTPEWKKAVVTLKQGSKIDLA